MRLLALMAALVLAPTAGAVEPQPAPPPRPIEIMVVGTWHMANPNRDMHDVASPDVLTPGRQAELAAIAAGLARFHPTKVAVESPAALVAERWPKFLAGTLPPSHNEVVQLGFRLAKVAAAKGVFGVDAEADFPFEPVKAFADAHGLAPLLAAADSKVADDERAIQSRLDQAGMAAAFRYINDPARLAVDNAFYRSMLFVGAGADQPGADLLTAWYRRNFRICAQVLQLARPGDRIVVLFGSGHAFLLRQCARETPGVRLIEAEDYLPAG